VQVVKYEVDGALTAAALPDMVAGLSALHGLPEPLPGYAAAAASISIGYDAVTRTEIRPLGLILLIVGVIPLYLGYAYKVWGFLFSPIGSPPKALYLFGWRLREEPGSGVPSDSGAELMWSGKRN
jgi:hypothetical protein